MVKNGKKINLIRETRRKGLEARGIEPRALDIPRIPLMFEILFPIDICFKLLLQGGA